MRLANPFLTPRLPPETHPKTEPAKPIKVDNNQDLCKICGHFLDGVGPGLLYAQQQYRISVAKNGADIMSQMDSNNLSPNEEFPDIFKNKKQFLEWESEIQLSQSTTLPPRSIYFDHAQHDNDRFGRKLAYQELPFQLTSEKVEDRGTKRKICDNCLESSTTSSVEEIQENFKKRTSSTATPRGRMFLSSGLDHCDKAVGLGGKIPRTEKFVIQDLLLIKRIASVFIYFNGFKPSLRIGATSFRNMARKCRLCESGAMPAIDILFIDVMRQWQRQINDHTTPYYNTFRMKNPIISHQPQRLPFQGFLETIFRIAKSRFKGVSLKEKLEVLVCNCEHYMKEANRAASKMSKRRKEIHVPKLSQMPSPRISGVMSTRQPYF